MIEIGRLCIKLSGREAGRKCVVVDIQDKNFVVIDGDVKRRKCNIDHLIALPEKLDIKKGAKTEEIRTLLKKQGLIKEKKPAVANKKPRKAGEKPKKIRPRKKAEAPKKGTKKAKKSEDEIVEQALAKA